MKVLLSLGARVNWQNTAYETPLHAAAKSGSVDAVKLLLAHGANVNATQPGTGSTPICLGAYLKHAGVVELLMAAGANVNCRRSDGWTPLHAAVENRDARTAKALLAAGADVNAKNKNGPTPLSMIGSSSDEGDWQALLLSHGARIELQKIPQAEWVLRQLISLHLVLGRFFPFSAGPAGRQTS